jgi:hypothetical protein
MFEKSIEIDDIDLMLDFYNKGQTFKFRRGSHKTFIKD